jgi:glycosyltransferase involved in cell wall biosynthesis
MDDTTHIREASKAAAPIVSVVIPSYDSAKYACRAVRSVLEQAIRDVEVVLVDDGSEAGCGAILDELAFDPRVCLVRNPHNLGNCAARRRGWEVARGRFVAFLDDDDRHRPHYLETCLALFARRPELGCLYSRYEQCDSDGKHRRVRPERGYHGNIFAREVSKGSVKTSTLMVRRECLRSLTDLFEHFKATGEYEMILRLALAEQFGFIEEPLVDVLDRPDSVSKDHSRRHFNRIEVLQKLLRVHPRNDPSGRNALRRKLAFYYAKAGRRAARAGRMDEARTLHFKGVAQRPTVRGLRDSIRSLFY